MSRPTKEQRELRSNIEADYKRDSIQYTTIEDEFIHYANIRGDDCFMAYPMAEECALRRHPKRYRENDIYAYRIIEYPALGEYPETGGHGLNDYDSDLTANQKKELRDRYDRFIDKNKNSSIVGIANTPIITNNRTNAGYQNKRALVEIDFTKPLEEIVAIVTKIKKDFDKNPDTIQTTEEFLGIAEKQEVHLSTLKDEIYKKPSHKPLYGRLVDALFIYDCNNAGLTKSYALNEINWYWNKKNLFTETMSKNTLNNYLEFAQRQIDGGLYKNFVSGQKYPLY